MATDTIQMDYEQIQMVSRKFQQSAMAVNAVATISITVIDGFKAMPFVGQALTAYYTQWQNNIRTSSTNLQKLLNNMAKGLLQAIGDHKTGDDVGKSYFT